MTKVHWISNETPDRFGQGGQRRQFFQIQTLKGAGHQIRVVTLSGPQDDTSLRTIADDVHRIPPLEVRGRLPIPWRRRALKQRLSDWGDVVVVAHGESWKRFSWALPEGKSLLVDLHNVFSRWPFEDGTVDRAHWASVERRILASGDLVTVVSAREAEALPPGVGAVAVAENGVDPKEWPTEPQPATTPVLKLFGNWGWAPNTAGLEWFARHVWPDVHEATGAICHVAGGGVPPSLAQTRGLVAHGRVDNLQSFLHDAWVIAVPLPQTIGAPVKFTEALAVGVPVITTEQGACTHPDLATVSDDAHQWIETLSNWLGGGTPPPTLDPTQRRERLRELSWHSSTTPILQWLEAVSG